MIVYRIAKRNRASDISGMGAALYPGRWNKQGTPVLYTGESKEIALLEQLVHLPPMITPQLDILTIEIPDNSIKKLAISDLPANWAQFPAPTILSELGQKWVDEGEYLALMVPSCIIHTAFNPVLNCAHKDYANQVSVVAQQAFDFDSRLRKQAL